MSEITHPLVAQLLIAVPDLDSEYEELPYVAFAEFGDFLVTRVRHHGVLTPEAIKAIKFIDDAFESGNRDLMDLIIASTFEQLSDHKDVTRALLGVLSDASRAGLQSVLSWAARKD